MSNIEDRRKSDSISWVDQLKISGWSRQHGHAERMASNAISGDAEEIWERPCGCIYKGTDLAWRIMMAEKEHNIQCPNHE